MSQLGTVASPGMAPRRKRRAVPVAVTTAAAVLAVVVAVVAYRLYADRPITATGAVTITENVLGGRTCLGTNDDEGLRKGAAVVIRAPSDQIVASGELDAGAGGDLLAGNAQTCRFTFSVSGVPRERFYRIAVGGRSPVVFTYRQVVDRKVSLH
jgi:hypothetical protein